MVLCAGSASLASAVGAVVAGPARGAASLVAAEPLDAEEAAVVALFERNTRGVVNGIDVSGVGGLPLPGGGGAGAGMEVPEGNGSGCVWDTEGHVVTNYHVVARAATQKGSRLKVRVLDAAGVSREYEGRIVGTDKAKDLAVLEVVGAPAGAFAPLALGTGGAPLRVGQKVYAIGNPFGFDHTLTTGVVSGLEREITSRADGGVIRGGIQTDASINPGNSGGALLDSSGRLVGVNTAIYTPTGVSAGVGFALPIDLVARSVPRILAVAHAGDDVGPAGGGLAGVEFAKAKVAQALLPDVTPVPGPMVLAVSPGSPAERAGLRPVRRGFAGLEPGDVLVAVNGVPVRDADAVADALLDAPLDGKPITLALLDGRTLTLQPGAAPNA